MKKQSKRIHSKAFEQATKERNRINSTILVGIGIEPKESHYKSLFKHITNSFDISELIKMIEDITASVLEAHKEGIGGFSLTESITILTRLKEAFTANWIISNIDPINPNEHE
jgi:hypothetical protein